jgi:rhamnosyl/mannosyltransferase
VSVLIGGTGPEETRLRDLSEKIGLRDKVTFLGRVDPENRSDFWRSVDVLLTLDKFPPLALSSIQEAMLAGRPFIASGLGTSPYAELPFGVVLGPDVRTDLKRAFEDLLSNQGKVAVMGSEAKRFSLQHFTKESVRKSLLFAYDSALESSI